MALTGTPQFLQVRSTLHSGSGATEVDQSQNGLDKTVTQPLNAVDVTQTITQGPTTQGPVFVGVNGTMWILPFNQACAAPKYVFDALDSTYWTHA